MTKINNILTAEIEKNKIRNGSITTEIKRLLTDVYKKLSIEVNFKITNKLSAHLSEVNSTFTESIMNFAPEGRAIFERRPVNVFELHTTDFF